jgi:hypothetical protein
VTQIDAVFKNFFVDKLGFRSGVVEDFPSAPIPEDWQANLFSLVLHAVLSLYGASDYRPRELAETPVD